jgi:hypothetical protein
LNSGRAARTPVASLIGTNWNFCGGGLRQHMESKKRTEKQQNKKKNHFP